MKRLLCTVTVLSLSSTLWAQTPTGPKTVALVAAVGDQLEVVRQRQTAGSNLEPFTRKRFPLNSQALNYAVLRGLDRAIEDEEPQARRVLLAWNSPPELQRRLAEAPNQDRDALVLAALKEHLKSLPARAQWDRIEAIVPGYFYEGLSGLGRKLSGLGFYVQPLSNGAIPVEWALNGDAGAAAAAGNLEPEKDADRRTLDPNTGQVGHSYTFIATYMYFQRITLDARTLDVLATKPQFDNVKYADPQSTAVDVADQIPLSVMTAKLLEMAEQSAYTSVRGKSYVSTSAPRAIVPAPAPAASAPR